MDYAFPKEDLKGLISPQNSLCVSIYMPTHRIAQEVQQDPIRLGNLLRRAEGLLIDGGLRPPEVKTLLEPAQPLLRDILFWKYQNYGLGLFMANNFFRYQHVPITFDEQVVVSRRFYIKPLLPLLSGERRFYVLALSKKKVRLFDGTRYTVKEIELEKVPQGLAEALKYDQIERQIQYHTHTPQGGGRRAAMFHGQAAVIDDAKDLILRYFQQVDRGLHEFLRDKRTPLLLAGVDYLFPIYREANTYPHLVDKGVPGNPDRVSEEELHKQALIVMESYFKKAEEDGLVLYETLAGTGKTSSNTEEILKAAYHGQVNLLFVPSNLQTWGTFDPVAGAITIQEKAGPESQDLLELAAVHTILNGGFVHTVPKERMPDHVSLAALFRY
jgi:hypothetical protein